MDTLVKLVRTLDPRPSTLDPRPATRDPRPHCASSNSQQLPDAHLFQNHSNLLHYICPPAAVASSRHRARGPCLICPRPLTVPFAAVHFWRARRKDWCERTLRIHTCSQHTLSHLRHSLATTRTTPNKSCQCAAIPRRPQIPGHDLGPRPATCDPRPATHGRRL
jgi:hypothetical protein